MRLEGWTLGGWGSVCASGVLCSSSPLGLVFLCGSDSLAEDQAYCQTALVTPTLKLKEGALYCRCTAVLLGIGIGQHAVKAGRVDSSAHQLIHVHWLLPVSATCQHPAGTTATGTG